MPSIRRNTTLREKPATFPRNNNMKKINKVYYLVILTFTPPQTPSPHGSTCGNLPALPPKRLVRAYKPRKSYPPPPSWLYCALPR